jgi:hypothetical protein
MHLLVGSGSSLLSVGKVYVGYLHMTLMSSLCETSLAPLRSKSSIDPPLFKMRTFFLWAFSFAIETTAFAQMIASPFSYAM